MLSGTASVSSAPASAAPVSMGLSGEEPRPESLSGEGASLSAENSLGRGVVREEEAGLLTWSRGP